MYWRRTLRPFLKSYLASFALSLGFLSHGLWNLGEVGAQWWALQESYPAWLRIPVGGLECLIAILVYGSKTRKWASLLGLVLMLGAIRVHWRHGFNQKNGGFELAFVYAIFCLQILINEKD